MSFEYIIFNKNQSTNSLFDAINSKLVAIDGVDISYTENTTDLKDKELKSSWSYDIRLIRRMSDVSVILVGWSDCLYKLLKSSLDGLSYDIFDEDSEEFISIEKMFRITQL